MTLAYPEAVEVSVSIFREDAIDPTHFCEGTRLVLSKYVDFPIVFWTIKEGCHFLSPLRANGQIKAIIKEATDFTKIWQVASPPFYREKLPFEDVGSEKFYRFGETAVPLLAGFYPAIDWRFYTVSQNEENPGNFSRPSWGIVESKFDDWCAKVIAGLKLRIKEIEKRDSLDYWHVGDCAYHFLLRNEAVDIDTASEDILNLLRASDIDIAADRELSEAILAR